MKAFQYLTSFFNQDARHFQLVYLATFLLIGHTLLRWYPSPLHYLAAILACLLAQAIGNSLIGRNWYDLKSAGITALGLCLLCHTNSPWVLFLAGSVAIAGKFLIRFHQKHVFNPANFGIILAILLTDQAWVSPGQWGQESLMILFFSAAGFMILFRTGRLDVGLVFFICLATLLFIRDILFKGWPLDYFLHTLSNGSLLLFSFFMVTDPVSTPNAPKARYFWAIWIAFLTFILSAWFQVYDAPIWALFVSAPLTAFLDRAFKHKRFSWQDSFKSQILFTNR